MTPEQEDQFELALDTTRVEERLQLLLVLEVSLPDDPEIQQQLGVCHITLGDHDEAERMLLASLRCKDDGWTRLYLGNLHWQRDDLDSAEQESRRTLALLPEFRLLGSAEEETL